MGLSLALHGAFLLLRHARGEGAAPPCEGSGARVHVATFASQLDLGMSSFFASAAATIGQVMLLDYGLGANWGNLTIRLHALNRYISQMLPAQQCDWVVFVDCYDSVIIGKEADICVRLERLEADSGRSVFFGAETWKGDLVDEQEAHAKQMNVNGPWRFLNAGLMAGRVWALRDFLSVPIQEDANDQVFVTEVMLYHKPQLATLDYRSELFLNAYGIEGILDGPWAEELLQPAGSVVFVEAEGRRWIENRPGSHAASWQHVVTYQEAAALGLANVEQRAARNHLEAMSELQAALANSVFKAATREKALIAEMSLAQAYSVSEDSRLREELAELHQKSVSDALDLQLEESRYAQNLQEQANQHVQNSQEVMLEQFQAHFQIYKDRQKEEHEAVVSELREQNDDLQDRLDSAERALEKALEQANPATPKGQPTPAPSTPKAARTTTAGPAVAKAPSVAASPAADPGAPTSEVLSTGLLETQMAILSRLRDLKGESKEESSKPKVKEAETINLPEFPNPEAYRSWKTATREAVRAASDSPDEAFKWILEAYAKDANHESLCDAGKFLTLDTKLLAALAKVARGELSREILIFKETEASKSRAVRGRQVLYLFDQYFKTNEEVGSLYSVEDLLKVRLLNDDLSTFINNWESVWAKSHSGRNDVA
eukprot:s6987_g3.t1